MKELRASSSWNIGIMEYWNNVLRRRKTRNLLFAILIPIIPPFQQSIIPILQEITPRNKGSPPERPETPDILNIESVNSFCYIVPGRRDRLSPGEGILGHHVDPEVKAGDFGSGEGGRDDGEQ